MIPFFIGLLTGFSASFRSRYNLGLEILALREQLGILKRSIPCPRLQIEDRNFLEFCSAAFGLGGEVLIIVNQRPCRLASRRLSFVLASLLSGNKSWQAKDRC
jgi:hypothetical protein